MSEENRDLIEVVIACCNGQMGREAAMEVISELSLAGFKIVPAVPAQQPAGYIDFPYQQTFDAIVAATSLWPTKAEPSGISVSVQKFVETFNAAAPRSPAEGDSAVFTKRLNEANAEIASWRRVAERLETERQQALVHVEEVDVWLAKAADQLNITPIMQAMDLGNEITQWRLARQKPSSTMSLPASHTTMAGASDALGSNLARRQGEWPVGCHDPDSCHRHSACMYVQCRRHKQDGNEVAAEIAAATKLPPQGRSPADVETPNLPQMLARDGDHNG